MNAGRWRVVVAACAEHRRNRALPTLRRWLSAPCSGSVRFVVGDRSVADRADDDLAGLDGVEDAVVADTGRPKAFHAADEPLPGRLWFARDQVERFEDSFADGYREIGEVVLGSSGESYIRQVRARVLPRRGRRGDRS